MVTLQGKRIVLGISGGIAAYKCNQLIREYIKAGAEVRVVVTPSALRFVSELTLAALSKNHVISDTFSPENGHTWHINLAEWADIIVVAPATVNTVAKIASGFADNALTTFILAKRSPVLICPAADVDMYENPISQRNYKTLTENGFFVLEAESGELASGLVGKGRLPEISKILDATVTVLLGFRNDLAGKKLLITAGPTYEDIDPVRYIGNRSSGKMGFALAEAAYLRGAEVTVVSGPTVITTYPEIKRINVRSANEMHHAVLQETDTHDILIMAAAVADYRPAQFAEQKIKKGDGITSISLVENPDILKTLSETQLFKVGFALETTDEVANAQKKLVSKSLDMIVLNSLRSVNSGFEYDTNSVHIFAKSGYSQAYTNAPKFVIAHQILSEVLQNYGK